MAIVVTGATGHVGRPLVMRLHAAGAQVRAVTRNPEIAGFPTGVEVVASAFDALPGASAVFLNSHALVDQLSQIVEAAQGAGVTRLVALSAINADDDLSRQPSRVLGDRNKEVEQLAMESGLQWISLRPTVFVTTYVGAVWAAQIRAGDVVRGPYAEACNSPIVETDIAAVATHAFLSDDLVGQQIPLTGPEAFTNGELVQAIGEVLGRSLRYEEVPPEIVRENFIAAGVSAAFADAYIAFMQQTVKQPVSVTPDVERVLGRPARPLADWVTDHRDLFVA
jgi:uncharacterized protein YbjT (DUF2867 family)